jgi:hypothetical protein
MKLVEPFAYIDPTGERWDAPVGAVVDGASIPRFAWTAIGGPFEGSYRDASVIHDVGCVEQSRPWQAVHRMFFTAMLASGVELLKAKIMYAAVYHFGPRWSRPTVRLSGVPIGHVKSVVASVEAAALPGDLTDVTITPGPVRPRPCKDCSAELPPLPPDTADVEVAFRPSERVLTESDFERLAQAITNADLSLESIERFR